MSKTEQDFRSIDDKEVKKTLQLIARDPSFVTGIGQQVFGSRIRSNKFLRWLITQGFNLSMLGVDSTNALCRRLKYPMERIFRQTFSALQVEGLENVDRNKPTFFLANHRDIALDALYLNYALVKVDKAPARVAIGDNLSKLPQWGFTMMRSVGCFLVKRQQKGKARVESIQELAHYIHESLGQGKSIWLAAKRGRSLDGDDSIEQPVLKMVEKIAKSDLENFSTEFNVCTSTISYEYDPCDVLKAEQLQISTDGTRALASNYDKQITQGMVGDKGRVKLVISKPTQVKNLEQLRDVFDTQTQNNYYIWPSAVAAYELLKESSNQMAAKLKPMIPSYSSEEIQQAKQKLQERLSEQSETIKDLVLQSYARPLFVDES